MSSFPLEGGNPAAALLRRGRGRETPRQAGITQTLDAPGLIPVPMVETEGQKLAADLGVSLGLIGNVAQASQALAIDEQQRRIQREEAASQMQRRLDAAAKEKQNEIEAAERGAATLFAQSKLPELQRRIVAGELAAPTGEDGLAIGDDEFADSLISELVPQDMSEAYRDAAEKSLRPRIMDAISARREASKAKAIEDNQILQLAGVGSIAKAEQLETAVANLRGNNPNLSDMQARALVFNESAKAAIESGDEAKLDAAASILPKGTMAAEIQDARTRIKSQSLTRENAARKAAMDGFRYRLGSGEPIESVYPDAKRAANSGEIDGSDLDQLRSRYDSVLESRRKESEKALDTVAIDQWRAQKKADIASIMLAANQTGGLSSIPSKFSFNTPSGKTETVTRKEIAQEVIADQFSQIDAEVPYTTQDGAVDAAAMDRNVARKVQFLAAQGGSSEAVYEPWQGLLNGVGSRVLVEGMTADQIPPAALGAKALYDQLVAQKAWGVINSHLTDDQSRQVLRAVDALERHSRQGSLTTDGRPTTAQAFADIAAIGDRLPKLGPVSTQSKVFTDARDAIASELEVTNVDDIEEQLATKAGLWRGLLRISDEAAIERAAQDIREDMRSVEGHATYTRSLDMPSNLDPIIASIKRAYLAENGVKHELKDSDIRIDVDARNGAVRIRSVAGGLVAPDSKILTTRDLHRIERFMAGLNLADQREALAIGSAAEQGRTKEIEQRAGNAPNEPFFLRPALRLRDFFVGGAEPSAEQRDSIAKFKSDARKIPDDASPELRSVLESIVNNHDMIKMRVAGLGGTK